MGTLIEPTPDNAGRVLDALKAAKFGAAYLATAERLLKMEVTVFNDWVPVGVQSRTPGLRFTTAWKNRVVRTVGGARIPFVSRRDLIRSKRAAGRPVGLEDVRLLTRK